VRRSRPLVVVAGLAIAGLVLLSWTQTWFTAHLDATSATASTVTADGSVAASSYSALAIASLALFLALTIAGPVLRVVLAVIEVLLGAAIVAEGVTALADPVATSASAIDGVTGVSDLASIRAAVTSIDTSPWPAVGIAAGVLAALLGIVVLVLQRSWPGPGRKYAANEDTVARRPRDDAPRDAVVDWDDLSAGVDPTDPAAPGDAEQAAARPGAAAAARPGAEAAAAEADGWGGPRTLGLGAHREPDDKEHREQR